MSMRGGVLRHLHLPPPAVDFTRATVLASFAALVVLAGIAVFRFSRSSSSSSSSSSRRTLVGLARSCHAPLDGEIQQEAKPTTLADEELGLDRTTPPPQLTTPPHHPTKQHQSPSPDPITVTTTPPSNMPPSPSILRPTARAPTPHTGPSATIPLAQGTYTGVLLPAGAATNLPHAVEAWRGIPYAQSTAGANRFRPPVPLEAKAEAEAEAAAAAGQNVTTTTTRADTFGAICPGSIARVAGVRAGEDCLNCNVYRRADCAGRTGMPVLVYVHGGAFNAGMGIERDMASLVGWADAGLVGVNFNYRVGALGFPSGGAADAEGCLNLGLRDQRALFAWVRANVGAFGGDARRVTVMGLSAGAHSIGYHLQSPSSLANPPFHAAILESGGSTARATLAATHPRTTAQWREFLHETSLAPTTPPAQVFAQLRALPLATILAASNAVFSRYQDPVRWPFQPTIETPCSSSSSSSYSDAGIITDLPIARFRRGEFLRIPILTGFNTNEGAVFCNPATHTEADMLAKFTGMLPALTARDTAQLAALYPDPSPSTSTSDRFARVPPGFGQQWARYEAAYAQYAYICPVLQTAHFYSEAFHRHALAQPARTAHPLSPPPPPPPPHIKEEEAPPVWVYHFAARTRPDLGGLANHGDEAVVVAHDMGAIGGCPGLVRTADAMHGAWVHFITSGDPNPPPPPPPPPPPNNIPSPTPSSAAAPFWPRFTSPYIGDTPAAPRKLRRKPDAPSQGRVMLFGEGNDERCGDGGGREAGCPARVVRLSEAREVAQCRFWWERVELSEGMGRWLDDGGKARL